MGHRSKSAGRRKRVRKASARSGRGGKWVRLRSVMTMTSNAAIPASYSTTNGAPEWVWVWMAKGAKALGVRRGG